MTSGRRLIIAFVPAIAAALALAAAWRFAELDLTLSHYDARGHLVVARRVVDSLTPGWRQLGALWLPLPHLLNVIPVQWMWNYQTGASAVLISIAAMSFGLGAMARFVARRTGSVSAALAAAAVVLLNPSVLYLTSTPMTEPLLFGLCWLALDALDRWMAMPIDSHDAPRPGLWLALAVLTRYEAWPIAVAMVVVGAASRPRGQRMSAAVRLGSWPLVAGAGFLLMGRLTLGRWSAQDTFFTPDNPAAGNVFAAIGQVLGGWFDLAGPFAFIAAAVGIGLSVAYAWKHRSAAPLVALTLFAAAAVAVAAFEGGHPFRIRYMASLVVASGALIGLALGAITARLRRWIAVAFVAATVFSRPPLALDAPVTREAQREQPEQLGRGTVTAALAARHDGLPILASMSALGHYMHETSRAGLHLADYLHEGNGNLWEAAIRSPSRHVGWILIEERAEGGDVLAALARRDLNFLAGFDRVAEGGGAALYRRK